MVVQKISLAHNPAEPIAKPKTKKQTKTKPKHSWRQKTHNHVKTEN
jgi:hypothetical protein